MAEYIRREDALEAFDEWIETTGAIPKGTSYYHECRGCIEDAPAAAVAPVVHAKWVGLEYDGYADGCPVYDLWECSNCGEEVSGEDVPTTHPWCHGCGARMDGE